MINNLSFWVLTKKIAINGLIKPFIATNFEVFIKMTYKIKDKKNLLALIKSKKKLKKTLQQHKTKTDYNIIFGYKSDL